VAKKKEPSPFGRRLRQIRTSRKMTQLDLTAATGIPQSVITRLERSPKANPTLETLLKIATALECTVGELVDVADDPTSSSSH
jgi:putative transcriptional regulator